MIEKNTIQRMLRFFFTYPTRETHLRELSRELAISMPTILSTVKELEKEKLISTEKRKALTVVKARFDTAAFTRLKKVNNLEMLYECGLVDAIYTTFRRPQAIVCFGSYARGEDTEQSDIDIAIIGRTEQDMNTDEFEKKLKRTVSLHTIKAGQGSEDFKANLCNGIVLEGAL